MYVASLQTFSLSLLYRRLELEERDQSWVAAVRIKRIKRILD
jgi:hypothetical protein